PAVYDFWFFFFSSRRRHTRFSRDWSSDVCSSDLSQGKSAQGHGGRNGGEGTYLKAGAHFSAYAGADRMRRGRQAARNGRKAPLGVGRGGGRGRGGVAGGGGHSDRKTTRRERHRGE